MRVAVRFILALALLLLLFSVALPQCSLVRADAPSTTGLSDQQLHDMMQRFGLLPRDSGAQALDDADVVANAMNSLDMVWRNMQDKLSSSEIVQLRGSIAAAKQALHDKDPFTYVRQFLQIMQFVRGKK